MKQNFLGKTGIKVSHIALGTVELGIEYGIPSPSSKKPDHQKSIEILNYALKCGITFFDTAPAYGKSELLLGEVCNSNQDVIIATKIGVPKKEEDRNQYVTHSLETSIRNLGRNHLDIVQIHNATTDTFQDSDLLNTLVHAKDKGLIRYLGASVYEPEEALAAIDSDDIDIIQVAYNILDQRMKDIISEAKTKGMGTISRSVYLKGVLTKRVEYLPSEYQFLKNAALRIKNEFQLDSWDDVSEYAIRFVLSNPDIDSVLVGVSNMQELIFTLDIYHKRMMTGSERNQAEKCAVFDDYWLNPSNWKID